MAAYPELLSLGEAVTVRALLIALRQLLMWLVVVALCALAVALAYVLLWVPNKIVKTASFGLIGGLPGASAVIQMMTNQLASAVTNLDKAVGAFWHSLKTLTMEVGDEVFALAVLSGYIVWYLATKWNPAAIIARINHAQSTATHAKATAGAAAKTAAGTKAIANSTAHTAAIAATKPIAARSHGIESVLSGRVAALESAVAGTLEPEYADLRARTKSLEDSAVRAYEQTKGLWRVVSIGTVAAVAVVALGRLGLGWLRCSNVGRVGRTLCGLPGSLLNDLLALVTDFLVLTNICVVIPWMEEAFSVVAAPLVSTLASAGAGLCKPGSSPPAELHTPALHLPAAPSTSLYLP